MAELGGNGAIIARRHSVSPDPVNTRLCPSVGPPSARFREGQQSKPLIKATLLENLPALWTAATLDESDDLMTSVLDTVYLELASSDSVTYV